MFRNLCRSAVTVLTREHQLYVWRTFPLPIQRAFSTSGSAVDDLTEGEKKLRDILKNKFPLSTTVEVSDISGGCGSMYEISIEAEEFRGLKTIKQHRMVNEALSEEIKMMHGLKVNTVVPKS